MKRLNPLKILPLLFLLCSCASVPEKQVPTGPSVTSCILDKAEGGYHCANIDHDPTFVAISDADLRCVSPSEFEQYLKSCKRKEIVELNFCAQDCADNSLCMTEKDWARISDRCR